MLLLCGGSATCGYSITCIVFSFVFFFKQKTAYEMRISDWSSDVCSSDLLNRPRLTARNVEYAACRRRLLQRLGKRPRNVAHLNEIALLPPILEHERGMAAGQTGRKDRQNARIGVG